MIQKQLNKKNMAIIFGLLAMVLLQSCGSKAMHETSIDEYAATRPFTASSFDSEKFDMYVDFSDGIVYAYKDENTSRHMLNLVNKVLQSTQMDSAYAMGQNKITNISNLTTTQFYNKVIDTRNYIDIMAPIEMSLKRITDGNNLAILVTDYEEYTQDRKIQHAAYAADYFNKWLKKGGNIIFYAFPYREKNIDKHLYITLFDNSAYSLDKEIQEAFEGLIHNYTRFNLSNTSYAISRNYPSKTQGGCNHCPIELDDIISYTNETGTGDSWRILKGQDAEFYPFGESWSEIYKGAQAAIADYKNTPASERDGLIDYKFLLGNLIIDFTNLDAYNVRDIDVAVYNIQNDFDTYTEYVNDSLDYYSPDIAEEDKPEKPVYRKVNHTEVPDMFVFNGTVENNIANVSFDFSPKFKGTLPSTIQDEEFIMVDIRIAQCEPDYSKVTNLFFWGNNSSLEQSVRLTMQKFKPEGKTLYRYYIKTL